MNIRTFRIGGIHPEENKLTHEAKTQVAALPKQAIFPLSQHIGAPAKPVVQKGDRVKVGTMIAEAGGFVSAPIFSSDGRSSPRTDARRDCESHQKRWCRWYGWRMFPHFHQADTSSNSKGRVRDYQCR